MSHHAINIISHGNLHTLAAQINVSLKHYFELIIPLLTWSNVVLTPSSHNTLPSLVKLPLLQLSQANSCAELTYTVELYVPVIGTNTNLYRGFVLALLHSTINNNLGFFHNLRRNQVCCYYKIMDVLRHVFPEVLLFYESEFQSLLWVMVISHGLSHN